jgi:hypothetical protein
MPRLNTFTLEIKTGENAGPERPQYSINSFPLDFDESEGSVAPGAVLKVTGTPQSFPHTLLLMGPSEGCWDIESVHATYDCADEDPYTIHLGAVSLDDNSDLNIWYERPVTAFDV